MEKIEFDSILVSFAELFLKSDNVRERFQRNLVKNINYALKQNNLKVNLYNKHDRIFVKTQNVDKSFECIKKIFGISWIAKAIYIKENNLQEIINFCKKNYESWVSKNQKFAIKARHDSTIKTSSNDIAIAIGNVIDRKVDLNNPDITIYVEIREFGTFIYFNTTPCYGGLPVGVSGKVLSLMSGGIDSPASSFLMLKRGCDLEYIHFHSFPLVSKASINKVKEIMEIMKSFQTKTKIYFIPFHKIQMQIKMKIEPEYRIVLYRRFMLRIAEKIAKQNECMALATGEALAQVSSQTLDNMKVIQNVVDPNVPILRPLIGLNKEEIISIAKDINTYEVSIQPQEDCCTLFTPKHPTTKANLEKVLEFEKLLNCDELIKEAIENVEIIEFK